jgi:hypothetical protein
LAAYNNRAPATKPTMAVLFKGLWFAAGARQTLERIKWNTKAQFK